MKTKLLRCMTALAAVLTASCSSNLELEGAFSPEVGSEEVEVTFAVNAVMDSETRDGGDASSSETGPGRHQAIIGKARNIDMLIYEVYDEDYSLLPQYGRGIVDFNGTMPTAVAAKGESAQNNQTIVNVGDTFKNYGEYEFTLRLMRNKTYHIAFWAQSSETDAFDTDTLGCVKVNYDGAENNDELRDAFCKVERFSVSASSGGTSNHSIILYRPMAQINVGTTGADYKNILQGERVFANKKVVKSKISLTGVSNTIDVVKDVIGEPMKDDAGNDKTVTFDWSYLPAYIGMEGNVPPTEDEKLIKDENEEFLKVDLNHDGQIKEYKTEYPTTEPKTVNGEEKRESLTEEFKYLSMCYVLVPASKNPELSPNDETTTPPSDGDYNLSDPYQSSVLGRVEVVLGEENGTAAFNKPLVLENVPVHRNWRTNILGGLSNSDKPEDDNSSIFQPLNLAIALNPMLDNEYNAGYNSDNDETSDWTDGKWSAKFPKTPEPEVTEPEEGDEAPGED